MLCAIRAHRAGNCYASGGTRTAAQVRDIFNRKMVVDGDAPSPMTIRVTHIYRRFYGEWRLVHRHADFPPADQRRKPASDHR